MNAYTSAIVLSTLILGSAGAPASTTVAATGEWEPYGLDGYDVLSLTQHDAHLYAAVYPSPLGPELFGHGVWRRHEHPDSNWVQLGLEGIGILGIWVRPDNPAIIYASVLDTFYYPQSDGHLLYRTANGGATWEPLEPGPPAQGSTSIVGIPSDPTKMLISAYVSSHGNRVVYRSADAGETWTGSQNAADVLVYSPVETHTVWTTFNSVFFTGRIFRSTDDGQTWEEKFYHPSGGFGPVAISPTGRVHVALRGAGIMSSDDDGQTWIVHPVPGDNSGLWAVDVSPGSPNLVMTTEYFLKGTAWLSADAGITWTNVSATIPDSLTYPDVMASRTEPGVFYVAAEGWDLTNNTAGVWRYEAEDVVTTPEPTPSVSKRLRLTLRENPVSGRAVFALSVPVDGVRSSLRVFDAQGRVVAELDTWQPSATGAEAIWDGTTSDGARVTPGVYFGVVETDRGKGTSRFVWLD